jgi:hypothetical protein
MFEFDDADMQDVDLLEGFEAEKAKIKECVWKILNGKYRARIKVKDVTDPKAIEENLKNAIEDQKKQLEDLKKSDDPEGQA